MNRYQEMSVEEIAVELERQADNNNTLAVYAIAREMIRRAR